MGFGVNENGYSGSAEVLAVLGSSEKNLEHFLSTWCLFYMSACVLLQLDPDWLT